jgi:carbon-monoxide dehydrogenase small subunit
VTDRWTLACNGRTVTVSAPADRLLIDVLREQLDLTGTKLGCGTGDCGACTVLLDGAAVNACLVYIAECDGRTVDTIEGVAATPAGAVVVDAFVEQDAVQCGICTPGFVVSAAAALPALGRAPERAAVQDALAGNLCRCTGYQPIVSAVQHAARALTAGEGP